MSDIFDETEENLRADKWIAIFKTAAPWVAGLLGAALLAALAVWGYQSWQAGIQTKSSEAYSAALESLGKGDKAVAKTQFEAVTKTGNPAYKAMAYQVLAGLALDENNAAQAVVQLDLAAKASKSPLISDGAALKAALILMDTAPYADVEKRLLPLTKEGRPFVSEAKEALAMAKLQAGDVKGARTDLQVLSVTLGTPEGVQSRARAYVAAIDSGAIPTALEMMKQPEAAMPVMPVMPQLQAMPGAAQ